MVNFMLDFLLIFLIIILIIVLLVILLTLVGVILDEFGFDVKGLIQNYFQRFNKKNN